MKSRQLIESVSIILSVGFVFFAVQAGFSNYLSYLLALLIIFFAIYISMKKRSKSASGLFSSSPQELFGIITIILLIIALTNGLLSPLFFFLYFVLFLLAFMNEPISIWVFALSTILYFIPQASNSLTTDVFIKLGSLLLIAPIAFFVAKEFERRQLLTRKIQTKTDEIIQEAAILKEEDKAKTPDEEEAIDEIIEEAQSLQTDLKEE